MSKLYAKAFQKVLYPFYETVLRGRNTFRYLKEYEAQQWLSVDEVLAIQYRKTRQLIEFCEQRVPFYQRTWKEIGFTSQDFKSLDDIQLLPRLTKATISSHYDEFIAPEFAATNIKKATGGSTGTPFKFELTRESYERRMAVMLRGYGWAGAAFGEKRLDIWGTDLGFASASARQKAGYFDRLARRKVMSSFAMSAANMHEFVDGINSYKPSVIVGYTSALVELAKSGVAKKNLVHIPDSVVTAAEMLLPDERALIESVFRAPVFHTYGSREFMLIGAECDRHEGYHMSADHMCVEVADENGKTTHNGSGDILITDLHNYGMPLIRYVVGDRAQGWGSAKKCSCGRGLPLLGPIEGRQADMLRTPDGRSVPGLIFPHMFKEFPWIKQFQVRQRVIETLEVHLITDGVAPEQGIEAIRAKIREVFGPTIAVAFHFPDAIELTPSGKRRVAICELKS